MLPYWLLFSVFAAGSLQYRRSAAPGREVATLLIVAAIFTALMIGLRYEVGGDWEAYQLIFDDMQFMQLGSVLALSDAGYALLNWLAKQAGAGIWTVNLVCASIFMWGLTKFARRQANPWLAIAIAVPYLIIVVAMGYTRQAVAIGIILAGLTRLEREQSMLRFGLYVLVAATFHKSAIIVLPLVAFAATRNKIVMLGIAVLMAAMLYYLFVATTIDRMIENYVIQNYDSQGAAIRVLMNVPPALLYLLLRKRFDIPEFERKLWLNFSLAAFGALGFLMMLESSAVVDRLALYLIPLQLFVFAHLPSMLTLGGRPNVQLTLAVLLYSALVQFVWLTSATHAHAWLPYQVFTP